MKLSQIRRKNEEKDSESLGSLKRKKFGNFRTFPVEFECTAGKPLFLKKVGLNSWAQQSATEKSFLLSKSAKPRTT